MESRAPFQTYFGGLKQIALKPLLIMRSPAKASRYNFSPTTQTSVKQFYCVLVALEVKKHLSQVTL